ncbi:anhydro-N-acetylmuramic acid kinase AnmK [Enterococcus sp. LJL120]
MLAIGLMSGTSLDGVDAALVEIHGAGLTTKVQLLDFLTLPLTEVAKAQIKLACDPLASTTPLVSQLNFKLGEIFLEACQKLIEKNQLSNQAIDFVASHGQTIWHQPQKTVGNTPNTLQIGEASVIAYGLQTTVVSDFRVMDVAAGGEGAPLVPYSEYLLYHNTQQTRLLQNIGGIGNVTVIPKENDFSKISAFDTGPGNMMIDEAMGQLFQKAFDESGQTAASGEIIPALQKELRNHPYLNELPPKTTGREVFGKFFVEELLGRYVAEKPADIIRTLTDFTAFSIADSYQKFILPQTGPDVEVIIGGGGAYNQFLLACLQTYLPDISVKTQESLGFSSEAKEAIAFAVLGNETLQGNPSNVPSATNAIRPVILGKIIYSPF